MAKKRLAERRVFEDEGMNDLLNMLLDAEDEIELEVSQARAVLNKALQKRGRIKKAIAGFDKLDRGEVEMSERDASVETT
jgi:hypothetical protein